MNQELRLPKKKEKSDQHQDTFNALWDVLVWDLKAMLNGRFPEERHDRSPFESKDYLACVRGADIAGNSRFALIQLKQDWEHLCSVYGFKTWKAEEFCPFCDALKDPATWVQGGVKAAWRKINKRSLCSLD